MANSNPSQDTDQSKYGLRARVASVRGDKWHYFKSSMWRLALISAGWWVLTAGQGGSWFALLLIPLVVMLSFCLIEPGNHPVRLRRLPFFIGYFAVRSVSAGFNVARLILHPRLPIKPGFVYYPIQLPDGAPLWLFSVALNLLPGTLCASQESHCFIIHVIDSDNPQETTMRQLEKQIRALFDIRTSVKK